MTEIRFQADADLRQAIVTGAIRRQPNLDFLTWIGHFHFTATSKHQTVCCRLPSTWQRRTVQHCHTNAGG